MKKITLITFFIVLLFNGKEVLSQATFTANPTDVALTTQLGGTGITISNPTLENGSRFFQLATFSNGNAGASLSIDTGVLMTTGTATQAFGSNGTAAFPSNSGVAATEQVQPTTYNDPDIIAIDPNANFDVVVFSFDVVLDPRLTALQIVYQFGSDEYPDYVGTVFNDVFGFFVSGPGITGSQNLALVPGTSNPVAVNSVNGGFLGCNNANAGIAAPADLSQSALFINNGFDTATPPGPAATCNTNSGAFPIFTEYNGITNQFTGTINGLTAGVTYRFKIAIADTGDRSLDSAVFINQIIGTNDIDGDGTSDQADLDDDNDGILDTAENTLNVDPSGDADGDFILNYEDFDDNGTATAPVCLDADLDGICDTLDPVFDFDGDNVSDHLDLDSDNDGIYDVVEAGGTDDDNDGDADGAPGNTAGTIGIPATAGTGLVPIETTAGTPDHLNLDSDNDGCSDANEAYSDPDADGGDGGQYGITDPATVDGDGLVTETGINYTLGTNTAVTFSNNASTCIDANTDVNSIQVLGSTGGLAIANVLVNDTFGGATATIGTVDITVVSSSNPNVTLNTANGEVNVAPGTAAGIYTIGYQICEAGSAMPCSTSLITIIVDGDYDLDGVGDTTDLDDDNDGILDTVECPAVTGTSVEGPNLVLNSNFDDGYAFWTSDFNRGRGNEDGGTGYPRTSGTCADQGWVAVSPYNSTNGICNTYYTYPNTLPGIPDGSVLIVDADQTGANVYYTGGPVPPGGGNDSGCDANYVPFTDGTPGTLANPNNTLYIDPSDVVGESYWKQTVPNIEANSTYIFRCFIYIVEQNPELAFIINGATIFNSPVGDGSAGQIGTWQEVEFNWNSVAVSGAVTIEIANTQAGCFGNDIRLDDITFAKLFADFDGDGISNCRDIDSDNDGIPDVVEAQPTVGYTALPNNGVVGTSVAANGIPNGFPAIGFTPENTDGTADGPDYLDLNSDDEGDNDTLEAGFTAATNTIDTDGDGLLNQYDASPTDAAGAIDYDDDQNGGSLDLPNVQDPVSTEVDYRDSTLGTDSDNDDVVDFFDLDDDNDGITDVVESGGNAPNGDEDGDGVPNWQDDTDNDPGNTIGDGSTTVYTDSNGDGVPDVYDLDGDGVPNHLDLDSDNDGIYDLVESGQFDNGAVDANGDGVIDGTPVNFGNNGLANSIESDDTFTATTASPTDTDGNVNDGPNYLDIDSDDDGIP
ncbi:choice-of-anchor L domain-containing protein, partial [Aquimarina aggregata]|uniref:choice-of-anchor L domain-containing protein n=1 Tax=Aquimarina aggregata TaxID=1642818 RepID=UPI0024921D75